MPPKTDEEIQRARLLSRASYINNRETIKAAVNERIVTRKLEALGENGTDVAISEVELALLEKRMQAKEIHDEFKKASNATGVLSSTQNTSLGLKRVRDEPFSDEPTPHDHLNKTADISKQLEEDEIQRRIVSDGDRLRAAEKTEEELEESRRQSHMTGYDLIQEQRRSLPVYQSREEFLKLIQENQVLVVEGETGSGKTTQLLQYLLEEEHRLKLGVTPTEVDQPIRRLICTQPRRLAATSVAERVAKEMGSVLGNTVGYKVRFDDKTNPDHTKIVFMTDGMMLKELTTDPSLKTASVVMVDEAHERSLSTDVLLGLLRDLVRGKPKSELRVILASATIQVEKFCEFFGSANTAVVSNRQSASGTYIPRMKIKGRTHKVEALYTKEAVADYVLTAADTAVQIHLEKPLPGDILIFLTGQDDIDRCAALITAKMEDLAEGARPLFVTPVYASLPPQQQREIHRQTPPGSRKVVIATNIAETSITINGIVYVIDCGLVKQNYFTGFIDELVVVPTSQASAGQRMGRAGRTQEGLCYRLFTPFMFQNELPKETEPEIRRSNLASVVLQLKAIGVDNLLSFDFLDPPPRHHLETAVKQLVFLGALDHRSGKLTDLGKTMAEFPLDPPLSKCLVLANKYRCANEMAIVAAVMTQEGGVFVQPQRQSQKKARSNQSALSEEDQKKAIVASRDRIFQGGTSDMFGYVMAFRVWMLNDCNERWAQEQYLNHKTLIKARDVYNQILGIYDRLGIDWKNAPSTESSPSASTAPLTLPQLNDALTMCLCQGFFSQAAKVDMMSRRSYVLVTPRRSTASGAAGAVSEGFADIHPSSSLAMDAEAVKAQSQRLLTHNTNNNTATNSRKLSPLVIYTQLRLTSSENPFMCHVAAVKDPQWLFAAAPKGYFEDQALLTHVANATMIAEKL